ncbi:MAG: POT family MFS transporter [Akkermansiaceae bacterium]|nr:POT family MFS transporter [Akkermansiaceae bacterium]
MRLGNKAGLMLFLIEKHTMATLPPQTKYIIGNEACERFCFYGMKAILIVYMTDVLLMSKDSAQEIVHLFNATIYILPLLGAWLADRFLGRYKTILFISLFYCLGNAVLATSDLATSVESKQIILFTGLFIIAIGTGGIKPCVSAFVGDQAGGFDSQTMTRIYSAFYWSINFGSFFAMLVIPFVRDNWGYGIAFAIPGVFMALATLVFWLGNNTYKHKAPAQPEFLSVLSCRIFGGARKACDKFGGEKVAQTTATALRIASFIVIAPIIVTLAVMAYNGATDIAVLSGLNETQVKLCALAAVFLYTVAIAIAGLKLAATMRVRNFFGTVGSMLFCKKEVTEELYNAEERKSARNMVRILVTFMLVIPFWSLFDQTASSWLLQGKSMQPLNFTLFGLQINFGAEQMQSLNPLLVMVLIPMLTLLVYPKVKQLASPLVRMGIGIVLAGISFGIVAVLQSILDSGVELSILWQAIPYLVLTVAEILVSTTGLEYAYTAAGEKLKSTVSSFWNLTIALGNVLVVCITSIISGATTQAFTLYGIMSVAVGLVFMFVTSRRCMKPEV